MGRWGLVQQGLEHGRLLKGEPPAFLFKRSVQSKAYSLFAILF